MGMKKIILVDDMVTNHLIFKSHLKDCPWIIETYKDTQQIISQLETLERPDLFVLDIEMPGVNGIDLAAILKKTKKFAEVPIIFFSTLDDDQMLTKAFEVGAIEFISKSMRSTELKLRIQNILHIEELKSATELLNKELSSKLKINQILFRVLFHDLANLISIIDANTMLAMAKLEEHPTFVRLQKCSRSVEQLKDILTSIRSLTDNAQGVNSNTSVSEAFNSLEFILSERLTQKSLILKSEVQGDLSVKIPKSFFIHQVLANFMTNAIKFSPVGGSIELKGYKENNQIIIEIIDQGPGMSEEVIQKILSEDEYYSTLGTKQEAGTGSGVKIAKFFLNKFSASLSYQKTLNNTGTVMQIKFEC